MFSYEDMHSSLTRRQFLKTTGILATGLAAAPASVRAAKSPNDKVVVGIIGCNGRGMDHINGFLSVPNVEIAYICDVDSRAVDKGVAAVGKKQERKPKGVKDFRRILEDPALDAGLRRRQTCLRRETRQP
jgi:hypothetical protein